jgi:hypothetical protein
MAILLCCFFLAVMLVAGWAIAHWIMGPVDRAAKGRQHAAQFSIGDLFCLFFLVQLPMAAVHSWRPRENGAPLWILDVIGAGVAVLLWWHGVRALSRAGVSNPWHRSVFLALVMPASLVGSTTVPVLGMVIAAGFLSGDGASVAAVASIVEVILLGLVFACGHVTRWTVGRLSPPGPATPPPVPEEKSDSPADIG